jgi:hypothetical protein
MGWKRTGNHSYFYRSRREGGRVVSEYIGRGEVTSLCTQLDQIDRQERDERRAEEQAEREAAEREEREIAAWFDGIEAVAVGAMLAAGFHKHHGQRRRRRNGGDERRGGGQTPTTAEAKPPAKMTWDEFIGLVKRAESGDRKALHQFREALKSGDYANWTRWLCDSYGNPAGWLKTSLAIAASGKERPASLEASEAKMDQIRAELAGPDPTPIERLLAERAAVCWFAVNLYETIFSQT